MIDARTEQCLNVDISAFQSDGDSLGLFEPDVLLTESYQEASDRKTYLEPEKNLMLAVLEDAVFCFQKNVRAKTQKGKALFREAEEWFMSPQDSRSSFSFEAICETLSIDAHYLREGLKNWKSKISDHQDTCHWGHATAARRGIAA